MEKQKSSYNLKEIKQGILKQYENAGIFDESDLDWLLACCLNKNRTELKLTKETSFKEYKKIKWALSKRLKNHMPISKIFKSANFYGENFFVNNHVLSPRSETELLVEQALLLLKEKPSATVLDLCCGSGVIGITIKKKMEQVNVTCLDISKKALYVAKKNAKLHGVKIKFSKSDMFSSLKKKLAYDMIISNPPYIKTAEIAHLDTEVKKFDPTISLDGGDDGLDFYKQISLKSCDYLKSNGHVLVEIGFDQAADVKKIFLKNFKDVTILKDYSGHDRMVIASK